MKEILDEQKLGDGTGGDARESRRRPLRARLSQARKASAWMLERRKRVALVEWAVGMVDRYQGEMGYSQSRPKSWIKLPASHKWVKLTNADCSSFAIRGYKVVGAPSPSAYGYTGYGSTYDQEPRGRHVTAPRLGDLVFFGSPGDVKFYVGTLAQLRELLPGSPAVKRFAGYPADTKMTVGHGSSRGPILQPLSWRSSFSSFRRYFGRK